MSKKSLENLVNKSELDNRSTTFSIKLRRIREHIGCGFNKANDRYITSYYEEWNNKFGTNICVNYWLDQVKCLNRLVSSGNHKIDVKKLISTPSISEKEALNDCGSKLKIGWSKTTVPDYENPQNLGTYGQ